MAVKIKSVANGSPVDGLDVRAGDVLISVNGHEIADVLDYMYYSAEISTELLIGRGDSRHTVLVTKSEYDDLGLEFGTFLMDKALAIQCPHDPLSGHAPGYGTGSVRTGGDPQPGHLAPPTGKESPP